MGGALPIVRLARLFAIEPRPRPRLHAIVVGTGLAAVGLVVDRVAGQREIVVKTIADPLIHVDRRVRARPNWATAGWC